MIHALAELGQYEKQRHPHLSNFDIWLEDAYDNGKYPHLFLIELEKIDENWRFNKIDVWENKASLKSKLLYRRGSSRGGDKTPTAKLGKTVETTFQQKILDWFKTNSDKPFLTAPQKSFLQDIHNTLIHYKQDILDAIAEKAILVNQKGIVFSLSFIQNMAHQFIGDFDFFSLFITEESKQSYLYSKTFKQYSFSKNKLCSVCNHIQNEVFGFFTSLKFYTVDKQGMVTGGFSQKDAWKNYPVCLNCALDIELGTRVMENYFQFSFYGLPYYVIPQIIHATDQDDIIEQIMDFKKNPKISDSDRIRLTQAEDEIFEFVAHQKNQLCLSLLFYDKPQKSVFKISLLIKDILPSRLMTLFEKKQIVDQICFFKHEKTTEGKNKYRFNFGVLRTFFPNSNNEGNFDKHFLELTEKIFKDSHIDYYFMVQRMITVIRKLFVNNDSFLRFKTMQGFMLIIFLNELNLFRFNKKETDMNKAFFDSFVIESKDHLENQVVSFFDQFKDFFKTDAHCSIFLLGILTQFLLNIQSKERGATPFRSKLKGLKMDARDISFLLPAITEKFDQYSTQYNKPYKYKDLTAIASKYLLSSGNYQNWHLSTDEMNFIFVLGMTLSQHFKISKKLKEE